MTIKEDERVKLVDGSGDALIRSPEAVPERKRKTVLVAAAKGSEFQAEFSLIETMIKEGTGANVILPNQGPMFELLSELSTALIVAFVREWPYGEVTPDVLLDEVPSAVFDQLKAIALPMFPALTANFKPDAAMSTGPDGKPVRDPASPSQPSAA